MRPAVRYNISMKNRQGGFIRKVMFVVVMVCFIFIIFLALSKYVVPGNITGFGLASSTPSDTTPSGNNPLLYFLGNSSGGSGGSVSGGSYSNAPAYGQSAGLSGVPSSSKSAFAGTISLGGGNASYSYQPFQEYVTLRNNGSESVNITGWTLTNGKGTRPIQTIENSYVYPVADSAVIGQGTEFLDPSGNFAVGPIVLAPGDNAIVTTGRPFVQYPFSITTNFRENICDGYLKNYPFMPSLEQDCPYPANDPAINTVTSECYDYMQSLGRCEDPYVSDKTRFDMETTPCQNFMTARLNYPACVAMHKNDASFSVGEWRIFLGKQQEMWASERETITLYDTRGLIVDQISY